MQRKSKMNMEWIPGDEKILIYGAGAFGRRVYDSLKKSQKRIIGFVVSQKNERVPDEIDGIVVFSFEGITENLLKDTLVVVATSEKYHKEIKDLFSGSNLNISSERVRFLSKTEVCGLYRNAFPVAPETFLMKTNPVSDEWGFDRGTPVDRYFIEDFLQKESLNLQNSTLTIEVGDDEYSRRFFPRAKHEILNYAEGMDLTKEGTIPENRYDVFICTQTFHQIYDVKKAIQGSWNLLKDGGVMLATVCGTIVKQARNEEYSHYWGFTPLAIERLMKEVYGENIIIEAFGNAMVATAFIQGLAVEELDMDLVNRVDDDFTICISIVAKKVCK